MLIQIDFRETELFQACQVELASQSASQLANLFDIQLETASLPLGDIMLTLKDKEENKENIVLLLERKTLADLAASIVDGRYDEQSYRLHGLSHHPHNIIYLIEGDLDKYKPNKRSKQGKQGKPQVIDANTLLSAMFSIQQYKGFSLMRTMNVQESARLICVMARKMMTNQQKKKTLYYSSKPREQMGEPMGKETRGEEGGEEKETNQRQKEETKEEKEYCTVVKQVKKDNVTASNIGEIMLCQIPHISAISAKAIMQQHGSIADLILHLQADPTCLDHCSITDPVNNKKRKINQSAIQRVRQWLTASSAESVAEVNESVVRPKKKRAKKETTNASVTDVEEVNANVADVPVVKLKEPKPRQPRVKTRVKTRVKKETKEDKSNANANAKMSFINMALGSIQQQKESK